MKTQFNDQLFQVLILMLKLKFLISIFKFKLYNLFLYHLYINSKINKF